MLKLLNTSFHYFCVCLKIYIFLKLYIKLGRYNMLFIKRTNNSFIKIIKYRLKLFLTRWEYVKRYQKGTKVSSPRCEGC